MYNGFAIGKLIRSLGPLTITDKTLINGILHLKKFEPEVIIKQLKGKKMDGIRETLSSEIPPDPLESVIYSTRNRSHSEILNPDDSFLEAS